MFEISEKSAKQFVSFAKRYSGKFSPVQIHLWFDKVDQSAANDSLLVRNSVPIGQFRSSPKTLARREKKSIIRYSDIGYILAYLPTGKPPYRELTLAELTLDAFLCGAKARKDGMSK